MKKALFLVLFLTVPLSAAVKTKIVDYKDGKTQLEGYYAYDDAVKGPRPGVIVVHEWTGFGDYVKGRAEQLAALGYAAFAIDMYGKGVHAKNHEEAAKLSGVYTKDRKLMRRRAKAGLDWLTAQSQVDKTRVAAIGYCFGGTTVLEMARAGFDLDAVASFHGGLDTPMPASPGDIKAKIMVFQGADDAWTYKGLAGLEDELKKAGADWQVVIFSGAVHGFTVPEAGNDPSTGKAYNEKADHRSWKMLKDFLTESFAR